METLAAGIPADFSLIALFLRATLTVKLVMLVLLAASVWSWAVIIQKLIALSAAKRAAAHSEEGTSSVSCAYGSRPKPSTGTRGIPGAYDQ